MRQNTLWIDTRLNEECMKYLNDACSGPEHKESYSNQLAGNISRSERIKDKDNWFYETTLKGLAERLFYRDCDNYYEEYIENETLPPEFELGVLWVNYQKKHEFNPLHFHNGGMGYSFVVFMKIPTNWEEQHALPFSANSNTPRASDFEFVWPLASDKLSKHAFPLSSEDEGRILFFPAWLEHQVFPFYGTEEDRVTISGNIVVVNPNAPKKQEISIDQYEEKEKILKMMENSVRVTKEELKWMKKERENVGSN